MVRILAIALLGLLNVACSQEDIIKRIAPPAQQDIARSYIEKLRNRDFADIEKAIDPSIAKEMTPGLLETMASMIPAGKPQSVKLVGANQFSSNDAGTTLNLSYEYQFQDNFFLINLARKTKDGAETIVGFRVLPLSAALESQNRFTLSDKSALQYAVLASAVVAVIFTLVALVVCVRTKIDKGKGLWVLFILFGFGKIMVNWKTGQFGFTVLAAQLFSASATASNFGPWIISVSLPLGAAVFLSRRKELAKAPVVKAEGTV